MSRDTARRALRMGTATAIRGFQQQQQSAASFCYHLLLLPLVVESHGHMSWPPNRVNGSLATAGAYTQPADVWPSFWFSQPANIPGEPLLNDKEYRTFNVDVESGPKDWTRRNPWRSPGLAPVIGSGCGSAGGGPIRHENGGMAPPGFKQGADALDVTRRSDNPIEWSRGSTAEVAFGLLANHGGGYSYRLCPDDGRTISEQCFQANVLEFASDKHTLRYASSQQNNYPPYNISVSIPDVDIPLTKWVDPENNSTWARNPIPACNLCDMSQCARIRNFSISQNCFQKCSGQGTGGGPGMQQGNSVCPPGTAQFPEPAAGISGFVSSNIRVWNIFDTLTVPSSLPTGNYLLSWRWDCEQSGQIWQNCADVILK